MKDCILQMLSNWLEERVEIMGTCDVSTFNANQSNFLVSDNGDGIVNDGDSVFLKIEMGGRPSGTSVSFNDASFQQQFQRICSSSSNGMEFNAEKYALDKYGVVLSEPQSHVRCLCDQYGVYKDGRFLGDIYGTSYGVMHFNEQVLDEVIPPLLKTNPAPCPITVEYTPEALKLLTKEGGAIGTDALYVATQNNERIRIGFSDPADPTQAIRFSTGEAPASLNAYVVDCDQDTHQFKIDLNTGSMEELVK